MRCWRGYLLEPSAYSLHMVQLVPLPPHHLGFSKVPNGLSFWYRLTRVVLDNGSWNGCCSSCCIAHEMFLCVGLSVIDLVVVMHWRWLGWSHFSSPVSQVKLPLMITNDTHTSLTNNVNNYWDELNKRILIHLKKILEYTWLKIETQTN